mgnify:CR=1 FL=1
MHSSPAPSRARRALAVLSLPVVGLFVGLLVAGAWGAFGPRTYEVVGHLRLIGTPADARATAQASATDAFRERVCAEREEPCGTPDREEFATVRQVYSQARIRVAAAAGSPAEAADLVGATLRALRVQARETAEVEAELESLPSAREPISPSPSHDLLAGALLGAFGGIAVAGLRRHRAGAP